MQKKVFKEIKNILLKTQQTLEEKTLVSNIFLENLIQQLKKFKDADIILTIKKIGFFRPSVYQYKVQNLKKLINFTLNNNNLYEYNQYLKNILYLCEISKDIKYIYKRILDYIYINPNLVKTFFAYADDFFYTYEYSPNSKYEIKLEAISYLIMLCRKNTNTSEKDLFAICNIPDSELNSIIELASNIIYFKKMEIKVDFFDYNINKIDKKKFSIVNNDFEKSLTFSYTKFELKKLSIYIDFTNSDNKFPVLNEITETFSDALTKLKSYEIRNNPFTRVCPKFKTIPQLINLINNDSVFLEEVTQLYLIFNDNFLSHEELDHKLIGDFSALDFIKLQRFFLLMSKFYRKIIAAEKIKNKKFTQRSSIIPVFRKQDFEKLTNNFFLKKNTFFNLITQFISEDFYQINDFYDIQYSPALNFGNKIIISPTILSHSNIIRSALWKSDINLSIKNKTDKMIETIKEKLLEANFSVFTDIKFGKYDIDIIAKYNNEIFIFECKNSYHPTNEYELRNTFEHLRKAEKQLNNLKYKLQDISTRKNLANNLNTSFYKCNFNFAIISSNRLLNGFKMKNFTCLYAQELINCISDGSIRVDNNEFRFWKNETFSINDLKDFINGKLLINYNSLAHEKTINIHFKDYIIQEKTFAYSVNEIKKFVEENYPIISHNNLATTET